MNNKTPSSAALASGCKKVDDYMSPADWADANPSKMQILQLSAEGKNYPQIAEIMRTSPSTVRNMASFLLYALDANRIQHAVAIGFRLGLLE